jgi:hypothetical protein
VNVRDWVGERLPTAPPALRERVTFQLGDAGRAASGEAAEQLAAAGVRVVDSLISTDCAARQNAIDLLAADALVTYAIESAADTSRDFAAAMDAMVMQIAALVEQAR